MVAWWWLLVAFGLGLATVGVPVLLYAIGFQRAWDRAWGYR